MRALIAGFVLSVAVSNASGQEFKDNTETSLSADQKDALLSLLVNSVVDPFSTQIVRIQQSKSTPGDYCGFLNTKNLNGAYTGFKSFRFIPSGPRIYLDTLCD
jgi:hypothetical protein